MAQPKTELQIDCCRSQPTVTVIIPAFNAAQYIGETLNSVLDQTISPHEVIVINDGSPDTEDLERALQTYKPNIHYVKQENCGAAAARNTGLRMANGDLIAFLDADDMWLPTYLEEQLAFMQRTDADLVYCDALLLGDSRVAGRSFMEIQPPRGPVTPENLLAVNVTLLTSAVLARKKPVLEAGLFDESIRRGHDFELWLRLAKCGARFEYQSKVLVQHRIVESGLSGDVISQLQRTLTVLETIKKQGELTATEHAALQINMDRTLAELALEHGKQKLLGRDFDGALQSFKEARKARYNWKLRLVCLGLRVAPGLLWLIYHRWAGQQEA